MLSKWLSLTFPLSLGPSTTLQAEVSWSPYVAVDQ